MQNKQGNYEKVLLIISAIIGIGVAGYFIYDSQSLGDRLALKNAQSRNVMNPPPTASVKDAIQRLTQKVTWVSPIKNGKPVPLNKSIVLLQKGDQLFDLQLPEPKLRDPMTNEFLLKFNIPNIESPNVGDLDPDNDGFTNLEEFTDNTNPMDPGSHPPVTKKLFLAKRVTHDYILRLNSSAAPYQVQRTTPEPRSTQFVNIGQEFGFERDANKQVITRFKALSYEVKMQKNPTNGLEKDVSELKCLDNSTNKEIVLILKQDVNLATYSAEFIFRIGANPETRTVKEGETFQIPGIGQTFKVLKIEETQAEIVPWDGGKPAGNPIIVPKG